MIQSYLGKSKTPLEQDLLQTQATVIQNKVNANRAIIFKENYLEFIFVDLPGDDKKNPLRLDKRADWSNPLIFVISSSDRPIDKPNINLSHLTHKARSEAIRSVP